MPTTKPDDIELPATDPAAAKALYEAHFGWTFTDYGPGYAAAQVDGVEIGLSTEATVGPAHATGAQRAVVVTAHQPSDG